MVCEILIPEEIRKSDLLSSYTIYQGVMSLKVFRRVVSYILVFLLVMENPQVVKAQTISDLFTSSVIPSVYSLDFYGDRDRSYYSINYFLNGGSANPFTVTSYSEGDLPLRLSIPSRPGYNFAGWYLESNYKNKIAVLEDMSYSDITLYAKWTRVIDSSYNVQMYSYQTSHMISKNNKELKDCDYGFVNSIDIPGMPSTREQDYAKNLITTYGQCPQGICLTEDFYLITAYCTDDDEGLGSLYVFSRETGEYLATIGMSKNTHLGGLTYDGTNIWICRSDCDSLERISYSYIKKLAKTKPQAFVDAGSMFEQYKVKNTPSCVTAFDGKIWVATHNTYFKSVLKAYEYRNSKLQEVESYVIPEKVQGITFDEDGFVYLSTSYGREKSSYLRVFTNVVDMDHAPDKPIRKVEMPPCSEEICFMNGKVYLLFESASLKYFEGTDGRGKSIAPIDKILTIDVDSIFS